MGRCYHVGDLEIIPIAVGGRIKAGWDLVRNPKRVNCGNMSKDLKDWS